MPSSSWICRAAVALVCLALLLAPATPAGQQPPTKTDSKSGQKPGVKPELKKSPGTDTGQDGDIVIKSDLVVLDVAVFDKDNKFVGDLKQEHFQVYEDQVLQSVQFFSREDAPISLGFVIDTSGSMRRKLPAAVQAALTIVKATRPGDEYFVIDFKEKAELVEEFTSRVADIEDALDNLLAGSGTAMMDAIAVSADYANQEGKNRRKAIVIMSDGDERDSFYNRKQLVDLMREYNVQVYIVGFPDELNDESGIFKKSQRRKAVDLITDLAGESGGRAFFPETNAEVAEVARQINTDLRSQYSIGYAPTNDKADGSFRKISVRVDDGKRKLVVRTRSGYNAPKSEAR